MVVIAEPIPTEKDINLIHGYIKQLHQMVKENPETYNKPVKIMDSYLAQLIYQYGMKILKPLYDNIDTYPIVCIVLAGGLVKLGVVRNFFLEENRGKLLNMIQEYKDFYNEYIAIQTIKKVEKEAGDSSFIMSRLKLADMQEVLKNDIRVLVYPIYATIDKCPKTCLAILYDLISKEKMASIFNKEHFGNIDAMVKRYKEFFIKNRVEYLVQKIASHPDVGSAKDNSYEKRVAIEEMIKIGQDALKPIYDIIDTYSITCTQLIPFITKTIPYEFKNFGIKPNGSANHNVQGMVADYKKWYKENYLDKEKEQVA